MRSISRVVNTQSRAQDELTTGKELRQQAPDVAIASSTRHTALSNNCSTPVGPDTTGTVLTVSTKTKHTRGLGLK